MKLAIFADKERQNFLEPILKPDALRTALKGYEFYGNYDDFIRELPRSRCDAVIVAHKGATGMQAVRAAKILLFRVPIVWLSDDSAFLEESYNNGCAYFSADPITETLLSAALNRCRAKGEN